MLSTTQIEKRAHLDGMLSTIWLGVFPADRLPSRITQYPRGLVANTDPSTQPGMHWVAMYFPDASTSEFFDSYGFPPSFYSPHFEKLLGKFPTQKRNTNDLQSLTSNVCGYYALNYVYQRNRGKTMNQIVSDPTLNDKSVKRKVNRFLPARGPYVFTYRHKKHPIQTNRRRHEVHRHLELKNQPHHGRPTY